MCCRFLMEESPEMRPLIEAMNRSPLIAGFQETGKIRTAGEVRPTEISPAVAVSRLGKRMVFPMRWGFREKGLLINARTETAAQKPLFREAWARHRCLIPASCYYEWEHLPGADGRTKTGDRFRLQTPETGITWLCGLYRMERGVPCYVILTRDPGEEIRFLHDRMPLILPEDCTDRWIRPETRPEDLLGAAVTALRFERAV